ncbi:MAG TPA: H(+)-transporting ATPase [Ruminococcus sp.]|nr:H(+)-transporting ATPase [Ruminococcus sp.]
MAGIDEILNIIGEQQKQSESSIISAAERRAERIIAEGNEKAETAYADTMKRSGEQLERDFLNACSSADAEIKRRILACKVGLIDEVLEKTLDRLDKLPADKYFEVIMNLIKQKQRSGDGVLSMNKKDLERMPDSFVKSLGELGTITVSDKPADIENGFILTYGLISENCSFRDMIASEREAVRDTAARALFGQVRS